MWFHLSSLPGSSSSSSFWSSFFLKHIPCYSSWSLISQFRPPSPCWNTSPLCHPLPPHFIFHVLFVFLSTICLCSVPSNFLPHCFFLQVLGKILRTPLHFDPIPSAMYTLKHVSLFLHVVPFPLPPFHLLLSTHHSSVIHSVNNWRCCFWFNPLCPTLFCFPSYLLLSYTTQILVHLHVQVS